MRKARRAVGLIALLMILGAGVPVSALSGGNDHVLAGQERVPIPVTYLPFKAIFNPEMPEDEPRGFKSAEDLYINAKGHLFVADTGNNRIVKMDETGKVLGIFHGPDEKRFSSPKGIFADENGNMYVADTGNKRVVHLSADGTFVEEFVKPQSDLIGEDNDFVPSRICVSSSGYIYVMNGETIMILDGYNRFRGYLGQAKIGYRLLDVLLRIFASEEQQRFVRRRAAASFKNIVLDDSGNIYATSSDSIEGEIKKLNSIGENTYAKYSEGAYSFGERLDDENNPIKPMLTDIAVDANGIVTVIDGSTGKIYQYDNEGNLLTIFGGMNSKKVGKFSTPSSIAMDAKGNLYVLDRTLNNIQVFQPTYFIDLVHQAVRLYADGEYDQAYGVWKKVLRIDENYQLAHAGMAKALFKQKKWQEAMLEYVNAEDRLGYSKAFAQYRYEGFRGYFALIVLGAAIAVVLLILVVKTLRKTGAEAQVHAGSLALLRPGPAHALKLSLNTLFHPIETFMTVKQYRDRLDYVGGVLILLAVAAARILFVFTVHFPLATVQPRTANIWLEMAVLLLPCLTWMIASFAISSIMSGESKLGEIFVASTYCMVPYVLVFPALGLLSNVLSRNEVGLFAVISSATWIWVILLFLISLKTLNDYSIMKTLRVAVISLVLMLLIWAVLFLIYFLSAQLYEFITGLFYEMLTAF